MSFGKYRQHFVIVYRDEVRSLIFLVAAEADVYFVVENPVCDLILVPFDDVEQDSGVIFRGIPG